MARKTVLVSDLTGDEIKDNTGATVVIRFTDQRRGSFQLDVRDDEVQELTSKARKIPTRGRPRKTAVA